MDKHWMLASLLLGCLCTTAWANGPAESVVESEQVLNELMAIPARQIPRRLLEEAQGIVIVPNVIKIGFVGGIRRGHGVVMVRDTEGEWSLPQFVTLTGGSVGFQAGVEGADVVLVFTTRNGVEDLMRGKFTVGVDASVAAGPVGRDAAIGTDAALRSEIYSYSRSRGLFLGVALDGSVLEIDEIAHATYYGTPTGQIPSRIPKAAGDLRHYLSDFTPGSGTPPIPEVPDVPASSPRVIEGLRRSINQHAGLLHSKLSPAWRQYLAIPRELQTPNAIPPRDEMDQVLQHYARVHDSAEYRALAREPEFLQTYELLREYEAAVRAKHPIIELPNPPTP